MTLQKVYVDSRHGQGPPCDKLYLAPMGLKCKRPTEHIEVACAHFTVAYKWNSVNASNNRFTLDDGVNPPVTIEVPVGNYTFEELTCTIDELLTDAGIAASVSYGRPYNTLRFELETAMTLSFDNASWKILGFAATDVPSGTIITSTAAIDLAPVDTVWVRLEQVIMAGEGCLANCGGRELRPTPILLTIPIDPAPFTRFTYRAGADDAEHGIAITDRELKSFRVVMTDADGNVMADFPDYVMSLNVRVVDDHISTIDENIAAVARNVQALTEMFGAEFTMRNMDGALEHFAALQVEPDVTQDE